MVRMRVTLTHKMVQKNWLTNYSPLFRSPLYTSSKIWILLISVHVPSRKQRERTTAMVNRIGFSKNVHQQSSATSPVVINVVRGIECGGDFRHFWRFDFYQDQKVGAETLLRSADATGTVGQGTIEFWAEIHHALSFLIWWNQMVLLLWDHCLVK